MSFYRFFQREEDGVWHPITDSPDVVEAAMREGAKKLTILAVNKPLGVEDAKRGNSYKGPFYADIDSDEGLEASIPAAQKLVRRLLHEFDTPRQALHIYLSGKKGFHVIVDQRAFMQRRTAVKDLPLIFKIMAAELYVPGLDMSPYSVGRNNTFRIANLKRYDGNYRVMCTVEELEEMTVDKYRHLVAKPRPEMVQQDYDGDCSVKLQLLYSASVDRLARHESELTSKVRGLAQSELAKISDKAPPCVEELMTGKGARNGVTFNDIALNMALWASRAQVPEVERERAFAMLADNMEASDRYPTTRSRMVELDSKYRYTLNSPDYKFGCNAMRAMVKSGASVCDGCPLQDGCTSNGPEFYTDLAEQLGLAQTASGYHRIHKRGATEPISTFTVHPEAIYMEEAVDGTGHRRRGTLCSLMRHGKVLSQVVMSEEAWGSKNSFIREIQGIQGVYYTGGDVEIQKIKMLVFAEEAEMPEIYQVKAAGIHIDSQPNGTDLITYVEEGRSLNNLQMVDTHRLQTGVPIKMPGRMFATTPMSPGDRNVGEALTALCNINEPATMAIVIGWFAACHLRAHLMAAFTQFPLLYLWGGSGSGKSKTVEVVSNLTGQSLNVDRVENVSGINRFNAIELLSSTTTIPRVCEEYNKSQMREENYIMLGELFKATWGGERVSRGAVRGGHGAVSTSIGLTGPVVIQAEQRITLPALIERSLVIMFKKSTRNRAAFLKASGLAIELRRFGLALMESALQTPVKDVRQMVLDQTDQAPDELWDDRPAYSLRVVHAGLRWMAEVARRHKLPQAAEEILRLKAELSKITLGQHEIDPTANKIQTEIDQILSTLNDMAADAGGILADMVSRGAPVPSRKVWFNPRTDWRVAGDELYLRATSAHRQYVEYVRAAGRQPRLTDANDFVQLVSHEPYFLRWQLLPEFGYGEKVLVLSLNRMEERRISGAALRSVYESFGAVDIHFG